MTDCDFFPENCVVEEQPDAVSKAEESGNSKYYDEVLEDEEEFLDMYGGGKGTMAKLGFIVLASQGMIYTGLKAFRHTMADGYYDVSDAVWDGFNWYKWADYIAYYGGFGLFALGFLTQLLDLFGVAGYFNFMMWGWGLGMVGPLAMGVAFLFKYLGYELAFNCKEDNDSTAAEAGNCASVYTSSWNQLLEWSIFNSEAWAMASGMTKYWIAAQYEQLPEEKKEKYRERSANWKEKKDMFALFGF